VKSQNILTTKEVKTIINSVVNLKLKNELEVKNLPNRSEGISEHFNYRWH
jgi:hypothetical protein